MAERAGLTLATRLPYVRGIMAHADEPHEASASLLRAARSGEKDALDVLFSVAYEELRRVARRVQRGPDDSLTTTALVHEAYLKLLPGGVPANDRAHFKLLVARAMRQILIDAARRRQAGKRGGMPANVTVTDQAGAEPFDPSRLLDLHLALSELERADPRRAAVVVCRLFGGLDVDDTAAALSISPTTVKRDWRLARAWLAEAMA